MIFALLLSAYVTGFSVSAEYTAEALKDQVTNLPGLTDSINFNQFSGYLKLKVNGTSATKNMHYWFVESQRDPSKDALAFWYNIILINYFIFH